MFALIQKYFNPKTLHTGGVSVDPEDPALLNSVY
jgi:hypothetical protein